MKKLDFIVEISIIFRILEVTETILTTNYQWRVISKTSEKSLKYRFWPINLQNICPWSDTFLPIFSIDHDKWTIFASFAENSSLLLQKWLLHPIRFEFLMIWSSMFLCYQFILYYIFIFNIFYIYLINPILKITITSLLFFLYLSF